jgi:hypothetical protein
MRGADLKPPQAAVGKSDGGERCGIIGDMIPAGMIEREASASEPLQKRRKRIRRYQNQGVTDLLTKSQHLNFADTITYFFAHAEEINEKLAYSAPQVVLNISVAVVYASLSPQNCD